MPEHATNESVKSRILDRLRREIGDDDPMTPTMSYEKYVGDYSKGSPGDSYTKQDIYSKF